jgi:hypothetical protein
MKKPHASQSGFFNWRVLIGFAFCLIGVLLALLAFGVYPGGIARAQGSQQSQQAGQTGPLTPEEAQRLAEGIKPLVNQSTEGLVQVEHADGSVSMDLQGRFQNVILAKKEANGTISQSCVDNPASAAAFLGIEAQLLSQATHTPGSKMPPENRSEGE